MTGRFQYFLGRLLEVGPRTLAAKCRQKFAPYLWFPYYRLGHWVRKRGSLASTELRSFGSLCEAALRTVSSSSSTRRPDCVSSWERLVRRNSLPVLGFGVVTQPSGQSWHADPFHGYVWPRRYFPRVDYVCSDVSADVKVPWELSRLQWLVWLAEAAVTAEPDERKHLTDRFLAIVEDWSAANPVGYGVNWTCGMEVAIRGVNLAVAAGVFAVHLPDSTASWLGGLLRQHLAYLRRFPEVSDVPGNHYLADLAGVAVLHAALDGLAAPATVNALAALATEADRQFDDDGCHIERATIYQRLCHEMLALPFALALRAGDHSAPKIGTVLARSSAFMAQISSDDGGLPVFGDQDSGFVLWFGESAQSVDRRVVGASGGVETPLFSFLKALAGSEEFFPVMRPGTGRRSGFATLARHSVRVTMKTGGQGLAGRAPHDHDDALSLCAFWGGQRLIIDAGCHSYTLDPRCRLESIVSSSHNAPLPADRERFLPTTGSINATVRGAPTATLEAFGDPAMSGRLTLGGSRGMSIERLVDVENGFRVFDRWVSRTPQAVRILWLFDPAWKLSDPDSLEEVGDVFAFRLSCGDKALTAKVRTHGGRVNKRVGRYSPDYGAYAACGALSIVATPAIEGWAELTII